MNKKFLEELIEKTYENLKKSLFTSKNKIYQMTELDRLTGWHTAHEFVTLVKHDEFRLEDEFFYRDETRKILISLSTKEMERRIEETFTDEDEKEVERLVEEMMLGVETNVRNIYR